MKREFIRTLKYVWAGLAIANFTLALRIQAGVQVTFDTVIFSGIVFLVLTVAVSIWQLKH